MVKARTAARLAPLRAPQRARRRARRRRASTPSAPPPPPSPRRPRRASARARADQAEALGRGLTSGADGWLRVADCLEDEANACEANADPAGAAHAFAAAAKAWSRMDPERANERARTLLRDAVARYRRLGLEAKADALLEWFTPTGTAP